MRNCWDVYDFATLHKRSNNAGSLKVMHSVRLSRRMHLHLSFSLSGRSLVYIRECVNDANLVNLSCARREGVRGV